MKSTLKRELNSTWNCWKGSACDQTCTCVDHPSVLARCTWSCCRPASVCGGWIKALGNVAPSGSVIALGAMQPTEDRVIRSFVLGCWRNGFKRPVLKHGPRSLTSMRVFGCQTRTRNESERRWEPLRVHHRPILMSSEMDLSKSISVGTRKMVNYAWIGWSQRKLWWRLVAVLTCKSIVKFGYRGERLIEPSSSWFLPKFPSG